MVMKSLFVCEQKTLYELTVGKTQLCDCHAISWATSSVVQVQ